MKIDLHCHSMYSHDSFLRPEDIVKRAILNKLDGVCFTEHYSVSASFPVENLKLPENFYLFRGVEISTNKGDLLVYGLKDDSWNKWSRNRYLDMDNVIDSVHMLGAICIIAHPFRGVNSIGNNIFNQHDLDGLETHNGSDGDENVVLNQMVATFKKLTSVGGSDAHVKSDIGKAFTVFEEPVKNIYELVEQIKLGKCYGSMGYI